MKITAAVTRATKSPMSLETIDIEPPRDDEILVRLVATGICHTDLAMRDQVFPVPQPIVLGHEGAGIVERIGKSVTRVAPGDPVVMSYNSCGRCPSCADHQANYCHDFFAYNFAGSRPDGTSPLSKGDQTIHGNFFGQSSFAAYALCHERNIVKVRDDAPLESLGPLACGVQTGAGAVINSFKMGIGQSIAVFGTGSVGLSAIMAAKLIGAGTIIAIDLIGQRLELARELGATHAIDAGKEKNLAEAVIGMTGAGVDYSFESTGVMTVLRQAVESLAPRGVCGFVGASPVGSELSIDVTHLMTAGRSIRGIVEGDTTPEVFIPALIDLHMQGRFPFDKLITYYPFEKINDAIDDAESGKTIKPVVRMSP